ncbi:MAG: hypothetical protein V3W22_06570 [Thermoplasmata archaeon]
MPHFAVVIAEPLWKRRRTELLRGDSWVALLRIEDRMWGVGEGEFSSPGPLSRSPWDQGHLQQWYGM